jgi:predicted HTH transcriptional regulator
MKEIPTKRSTLKLNDLKNLIKTGEGLYLEFKRTIPSAEKIARELCAFANTSGGTLMIGVDDNGSLVGMESFYEEQFLVNEAIYYLCEPELLATAEIVEFKTREIALIKVKEAPEKPVMVQLENGEKAGFIRVNDKSMRASKEMLRVLRNQTSDDGVTFEFGPNEQKLLRFLNEYERITVKEFSNLVNISYRRASRIMVNLVSAGVLHLFTHEKAEFYTLARSIP